MSLCFRAEKTFLILIPPLKPSRISIVLSDVGPRPVRPRTVRLHRSGGETMKRRIGGVALALLGVALIGNGDFTSRADAAGAGTQAFIAEICWQLDGFPDVVRLALNSSGSGLQVNGRQTVAGSYSFQLDGSASLDAVDGTFEITLAGDDSLDGPEYGWNPGEAVFTEHWKIGAGGNGTFEISRGATLVVAGNLSFLGACPAGSSAAAGRGAVSR
jgi:hypothetical protein